MGFEGLGTGGGAIGNASSVLTALLPSPSTLGASCLLEGIGSGVGLVQETGGELWDWVGGTSFVGIC